MKEYVTVWQDGQPTTLRWAAPVVRCRDCAHYATDNLGDYCTLLDFQDAKGMEDRFCAWGERLQDAVHGGRICAEEGGEA